VPVRREGADAGAIDAEELGIPEDVVEEKREWLGPGWDPDAFDLEAARQAFDLDRPPGPSSVEDSFVPDEDSLFGFPAEDDEGNLYDLEANLKATALATTGNLKGKLNRALRRLEEAIAPYVPRSADPDAGDGGGAYRP